MRMWGVDPRKMCREHLLGEHSELHLAVFLLRKGVSLRGFVEKGLMDISLISKRHDELAKEMSRRGYRHTSSLRISKRDLAKWLKANPYAPCISTSSNRKELRRRCRECRV